MTLSLEPKCYEFVPLADNSYPAVLPIWSLDPNHLKACTFEFKSPMGLHDSFPELAKTLKDKIRLISTEEFGDLSVLGAWKAFWRLNKTFLEKLCKDIGLRLPANASLFVVLFELVTHLLKLGEEEVMQWQPDIAYNVHGTGVRARTQQFGASIVEFFRIQEQEYVADIPRAEPAAVAMKSVTNSEFVVERGAVPQMSRALA